MPHERELPGHILNYSDSSFVSHYVVDAMMHDD
jgi:hypothetical protein